LFYKTILKKAPENGSAKVRFLLTRPTFNGKYFNEPGSFKVSGKFGLRKY